MATSIGHLMAVPRTTLYAAGHTRMHSQSAAVPNLTLAIVQKHVTITRPAETPSSAQTSHILEKAMGHQPTVIYITIPILRTATQTLHMTVGGGRLVSRVASQMMEMVGIHHNSLLRREYFRPLWFLAPCK